MTTNRYHTRVVVRLDSHINGQVDLTEDCVRFQCNKQVKTRGRFQFNLVPNRNYLNLIHPNDVVNVYMDVGDGKHGFVRTMFGYVDRVNRTETKDRDKGSTTTVFTVICSDFQKAIEQTNIYFNPHLQTFVDARFRNTLLGQGSTLRTNGVIASGTPPDFVENLLLTLGGFGQQWVLPESYPRFNSRRSRDLRVNRALKRLPGQLVKDLGVSDLVTGVAQINAFTQNLDEWISAAKKVLDTKKSLLSKITDPRAAVFVLGGTKNLASRVVKNELAFRVYQSALTLAQSDQPPGIVDLMEFGFIEHLAMDGFNANLSVWQSQGSLAQVIYGRSNPIVNELLFDLRPVSQSATGRVISDGEYSREPDELGINTEGYGGEEKNVDGVRYVPAVVMREYPYSTVQGFDLSNFYTFSDGPPVGFIPFGPIFAKRADDAKDEERVIYDYAEVYNSRNAAPLAPEACLFADDDPQFKSIKHMDVVKIYDTDIINMSVGRDDNDVINLFALYSTSSRTEAWKYILRDLSPIINPVSIQKNGLRVQEPKTEWANYSRDPECSTRGSAVDNAQIRRNLIRWQLLMDHWYQHNVEYLSGTCELRGMPWIRVGYRVDFVDRNESYYVEGVAHQWEYPNEPRTTLQLSRGQRNDPFPAYIPPATPDRYVRSYDVPVDVVAGGDVVESNLLNETQQITINTWKNNPEASLSPQDGGDRSETGRLGKFFKVKSTEGTLFSTNRGPDVDDDGNDIDISPNANGAGRAEYPGQIASVPAPGRFGNVPTEEDPDKIREREARAAEIREKSKGKRRGRSKK